MAPIGLFLSYASEEKAFVDTLREALAEKFNVWFDQDAIRLGENIAYRLPEGIRSSDYAVVVLSHSYITKKWTREEFSHLIALETADRKIILPIWHKITDNEVRDFYPALTLRNRIPYDLPMNAIVVAIEIGTGTAQKAREVGDPLRKEYSELNDALADYDATERLSRTEQGITLVNEEVSYLLDAFIKRLDQVKSAMQLRIDRRDQPIFTSPYRRALLVSGRFRLNIEIGYLHHGYNNDASHNKLVVTLFERDTFAEEREELRQIVFAPRFTVSEKVQWKNEEDATIHSSEEVVAIALKLFKYAIDLRLQQS
jgi:hypothetical protein